MIDALRNALGERLKLDTAVSSIDRKGESYTVFTERDGEIEADILVLATPAHATAGIVSNMNRQLSEMLGGIPYPSVSVACLGFERKKIERSLDGFGFLIPNREGRKILGALWDSSIFPDRAPEGSVLLRTMVGGARASGMALQEDEKILSNVMGELKAIMGISADPDFVRIYKHEKAIPQYNVGHQRILEELYSIVSQCRGLYLTGNAYRGISLNDCIENSYKWSEKILGLKEDL